jgi:hypothetical protein
MNRVQYNIFSLFLCYLALVNFNFHNLFSLLSTSIFIFHRQGDDQKIFKTFQNLNNNNNSMPLKHSFQPRETPAFEKRYTPEPPPPPHHPHHHPLPHHHQLPLNKPFDHHSMQQQQQKPLEITAYEKAMSIPLGSPFGSHLGSGQQHNGRYIVRHAAPPGGGDPMDEEPMKLVVKTDRRDQHRHLVDEDEDEVDDDEVDDEEEEEDDDDDDRLLVIAHREHGGGVGGGVHDLEDSDQGSSERGEDSV